jgi:hypothetical protein
MSNSTSLSSFALFPVPDSKFTVQHLQDNATYSLEELAGIAQAKKTLMTISYTPREASVQAVLDYARGENAH